MRKVVAVVIGCLIATAFGATVAVAGTGTTASSVTAHLTPGYKGTAPFKFTVYGVISPTQICTPGSSEEKGSASADYCTSTCAGTVAITFTPEADPMLSDAGDVVLTVDATLGPKCHYSGTGTIPTAALTAESHYGYGAKGTFDKLDVVSTFQGNSLLEPSVSTTQHATVKLVNPPAA